MLGDLEEPFRAGKQVLLDRCGEVEVPVEVIISDIVKDMDHLMPKFTLNIDIPKPGNRRNVLDIRSIAKDLYIDYDYMEEYVLSSLSLYHNNDDLFNLGFNTLR
ncbi:hypothetical protein ACJJTC_009211 [Scirpophaga incertulas]